MNIFIAELTKVFSNNGSVSAVTASLTVIGSILTFSIFKANRQRDRIARTFDFLNKWKQREFQEARDHVMEVIKPKINPDFIKSGFRGLDEKDFHSARMISNFLGFVGDAMIMGFLEDRLLLHEIGTPVIRLWKVLCPILEQERKRRENELQAELAGDRQKLIIGKNAYKERYADGFEYLAVRARDFRQNRAFPFHKFRWPSETL